MTIPLLVLAAALAVPAASPPAIPSGTAEVVDFDRFLADAEEARAAREERLATLADFLAMARDGDTVLLDTRGDAAFAALHLAGAVSLPFSDITEESLRRVLGDRGRRVLIYCNNNFEGDEPAFPSKAPPAALNIPTFVALWTYGYRNVYELGELVDPADPRLAFEGTQVAASRPRP